MFVKTNIFCNIKNNLTEQKYQYDKRNKIKYFLSIFINGNHKSS